MENKITYQGWECPKCGRVYSPTTPMCLYCGNKDTMINEQTSIPMDKLNIDTLTGIKNKFPDSTDCCTGPHIDSINAIRADKYPSHFYPKELSHEQWDNMSEDDKLKYQAANFRVRTI